MVIFSTKKILVTQVDIRKPCVNTGRSVSTQDNLASQEKIFVNGRHILSGQRKVDLCVLKEIGVLTQHCLTVFMVQGFLV